MSAHAYTEDQLVEQPAIGLFAELGWQVVGHLPTPALHPALPPEAIYEQKCSALFEHVYESYPERDAGTYAA